MNSQNYIFAYYQEIQDGSVMVGKWVRLAYEYLVTGLQKRWFFFDQKKANKAIKFIETFCHHCEGRNDLIKLELWQKALVSAIFGIVDEKGVRQFREVIIIVARKNGKSLFASAIANYCLVPKSSALLRSSIRPTSYITTFGRRFRLNPNLND